MYFTIDLKKEMKNSKHQIKKRSPNLDSAVKSIDFSQLIIQLANDYI